MLTGGTGWRRTDVANDGEALVGAAAVRRLGDETEPDLRAVRRRLQSAFAEPAADEAEVGHQIPPSSLRTSSIPA